MGSGQPSWQGLSAVKRKAERRLFEQVYAIESAGTQIAVFAHRFGTAALIVGVFDVHRAAPVLGSLGRFERAVLPLALPVLDVHLLDGAVEILDLNGAVIVIERDYLEKRTAV